MKPASECCTEAGDACHLLHRALLCDGKQFIYYITDGSAAYQRNGEADDFQLHRRSSIKIQQQDE